LLLKGGKKHLILLPESSWSRKTRVKKETRREGDLLFEMTEGTSGPSPTDKVGVLTLVGKSAGQGGKGCHARKKYRARGVRSGLGKIVRRKKENKGGPRRIYEKGEWREREKTVEEHGR